MKFIRFCLFIFIVFGFIGTLFIVADICSADDSSLSDIKFTGTDAVVIRYKGNVKIQKKNDNDWMIPAVGMKLKSGTRIKTGKTASYIELMLNYAEESAKKNVVRVERASFIELTRISPDNTQILLDKGELSCILQKTGKGTHFEIKTPVAICGAKGTGWKVTHNPKTIAYCFENKIFMQPLDDQGRPRGDQSNINEGHKKTMGGGGFIGPTKRIGSWQKRRWNSWVKDLGEFCNENLSRPSGKTADPYTAPPEGAGSNLNKDASNMSKNLDSKSKDARDNKKNEQNVQGSALRGDTDKDSDGDGVLDKDDLYPTDPNRASGNDLDGDGVDDEFDGDIDGDGVVNSGDAFPRDYYDQYDSDSDGWGNNEDAFADDSAIHSDRYGSRYEMRQEFYNLIEEGDIRNDIAQHRKDIYWRDMDARVTQLSDAQMHKVMKDMHGNRVRVEQYIMRPADNQVQILDINLRTADASEQGGRHGLSTLSFTTTFNRDIEGDELNELPWQDYLNVFEDDDIYIITSDNGTYYQVKMSNSKLAYPTKMEIDLAHNNDSIKETVYFGGINGGVGDRYQAVSDYEFKVNDMVEYSNINDYYGDVEQVGDGFEIKIGDERTLKAEFYVINKAGGADGVDDLDNLLDAYDIDGFDDLRDMLSIGLFSLSNGSNLEAVFNCSGLFSEPIDIIISPMKDSNWEPNVDWNWRAPTAPRSQDGRLEQVHKK